MLAPRTRIFAAVAEIDDAVVTVTYGTAEYAPPLSRLYPPRVLAGQVATRHQNLGESEAQVETTHVLLLENGRLELFQVDRTVAQCEVAELSLALSSLVAVREEFPDLLAPDLQDAVELIVRQETSLEQDMTDVDTRALRSLPIQAVLELLLSQVVTQDGDPSEKVLVELRHPSPHGPRRARGLTTRQALRVPCSRSREKVTMARQKPATRTRLPTRLESGPIRQPRRLINRNRRGMFLRRPSGSGSISFGRVTRECLRGT